MNVFAKILGRVLLGLLLLLTLLPFYLLVLNSFKWQNDIVLNPWTWAGAEHITNYAKALAQVARPMVNSLIVTAAVVGGTILCSLLAAYAFMRFKFFGSNVLYFGIIAMLMIPGYVMLIPQFIQINSLGLYSTYLGLILPPTAFNVAMGTFLLRTSMESISNSLLEAADMEGAKDLTILAKIVLPLSYPTIATVMIMTGLSSWNNYLWPLVASTGERTQQITVALTKMVKSLTEGEGVLFAGYVIASLPLILLFCFSSKYFIAGLTQGSVKG